MKIKWIPGLTFGIGVILLLTGQNEDGVGLACTVIGGILLFIQLIFKSSGSRSHKSSSYKSVSRPTPTPYTPARIETLPTPTPIETQVEKVVETKAVTCPQCGAEETPGSFFCSSCGSRLN